MSKGPMTIVAAIAAAALAGCGGSSSNSSSGPSLSAFKSGFQAQKASFTTIGRDLQAAITTASSNTPAKLATEFSSLASRTTQAAAAVRTLKPPAKYQAQVSQLAAGFDGVAADMTAVAAAAKKNDAKAAQTAARKLVTDSATVHTADLKLTQALGLKPTG